MDIKLTDGEVNSVCEVVLFASVIYKARIQDEETKSERYVKIDLNNGPNFAILSFHSLKDQMDRSSNWNARIGNMVIFDNKNGCLMVNDKITEATREHFGAIQSGKEKDRNLDSLSSVESQLFEALKGSRCFKETELFVSTIMSDLDDIEGGRVGCFREWRFVKKIMNESFCRINLRPNIQQRISDALIRIFRALKNEENSSREDTISFIVGLGIDVKKSNRLQILIPSLRNTIIYKYKVDVEPLFMRSGRPNISKDPFSESMRDKINRFRSGPQVVRSTTSSGIKVSDRRKKSDSTKSQKRIELEETNNSRFGDEKKLESPKDKKRRLSEVNLKEEETSSSSSSNSSSNEEEEKGTPIRIKKKRRISKTRKKKKKKSKVLSSSSSSESENEEPQAPLISNGTPDIGKLLQMVESMQNQFQATQQQQQQQQPSSSQLPNSQIMGQQSLNQTTNTTNPYSNMMQSNQFHHPQHSIQQNQMREISPTNLQSLSQTWLTNSEVPTNPLLFTVNGPPPFISEEIMCPNSVQDGLLAQGLANGNVDEVLRAIRSGADPNLYIDHPGGGGGKLTAWDLCYQCGMKDGLVTLLLYGVHVTDEMMTKQGNSSLDSIAVLLTFLRARSYNKNRRAYGKKLAHNKKKRQEEENRLRQQFDHQVSNIQNSNPIINQGNHRQPMKSSMKKPSFK